MQFKPFVFIITVSHDNCQREYTLTRSMTIVVPLKSPLSKKKRYEKASQLQTDFYYYYDHHHYHYLLAFQAFLSDSC